MAHARISDIVVCAARLADIPVKTLLGPAKFAKISKARQAAYLVARQYGHSYPSIGMRMNRDHSSVLHGIDAALNRAAREPEYAGFIAELVLEVELAPIFIPVPLPVEIAAAVPDREPSPAPRTEIKPIRSVKPKNDFSDEEDEKSPTSYCSVAAGSKALAQAIWAARAA